MNNLLLRGILPAPGQWVAELGDSEWVLWPICMCFVLLTFIVLLYMLMGVLVSVVGVIAQTEKESKQVVDLADQMRAVMLALGYDQAEPLTKIQFIKMTQEPEALWIMEDMGIDVIVLTDMVDMIFEDASQDGHTIPFSSLVSILLNLRGRNPASVKDIKEHDRLFKQHLVKSMAMTTAQLEKVFHESIHAVQEDLTSLRVCITNQLGDDTTTELDDDDEEDSIQVLPPSAPQPPTVNMPQMTTSASRSPSESVFSSDLPCSVP